MPKEYIKKRDELIRKGVPEKDAKRSAAIWYNKTHKRKMGGHEKGK